LCLRGYQVFKFEKIFLSITSFLARALPLPIKQAPLSFSAAGAFDSAFD